jgi:alkaline phosphatase
MNHPQSISTLQRVARTTIIFCMVLALSACIKPAADPDSVARHGAKNIILFIGDGMGVSTVTAARIFDGQSRGMTGEENWLEFERFPNVALVKTYNSNQQVPDSAGTATAMVTGRKTRAGVINIGPEARRRDCGEALAKPLQSIGEIAQQHGMAVGFVTTTRVTHATPATLYAHSPERDWEADWPIPAADWALGCRDMAYQLVHMDGAGLDVAMGGGRREFFGSGLGGKRRDPEDDLVRQWLAGGSGRSYITTADQLRSLRPGDQVLGLFADSHMTYIAERGKDSREPSLSQMTVAAIDLLAGNEQGFFLMVEGGRIDHGHHDGKPGYALLEAQEFNRAVGVALKKVDLKDTLVLVTADHSHVFTMSGYPTRGNPILGLVAGNDKRGEPNSGPTIAADGQPYTTLGYINGPGAVTALPRPAPETGIGAVAQALVPLVKEDIEGTLSNNETHGGEDVALYGTGVGAERVRGVIEQNRIFDIMMAAMGWEMAE